MRGRTASSSVRRRVRRWQRSGPVRSADDHLAVEEPLEIQLETRPVVVTMRTPGHDHELAAGFLLTEGLVAKSGDLVCIQPHPRARNGNVVQVFLAPEITIDFARLSRNVYMSSSCGLCGKATIAAVHQRFPRIRSRVQLAPEVLLQAADRLAKAQTTFARTGGLHAAAIGDLNGELVVVREDVGRHNAVDKVLGFGALNRLLPFDRHFLLVSGRASFEILQKALAARVPIVAAVSAPSSLAVEFATRSGQTLVGFLRDGRMNLYSHPERILGPQLSLRTAQV